MSRDQGLAGVCAVGRGVGQTKSLMGNSHASIDEGVRPALRPRVGPGIAIALAIPAPLFHNGQSVALSFGQGNFDGSNAFGLSLAGVLNKGAFGPTSSVTVSGGLGVGIETGTVASRTSVTFGW